jgi:hypothetical protein
VLPFYLKSLTSYEELCFADFNQYLAKLSAKSKIISVPIKLSTQENTWNRIGGGDRKSILVLVLKFTLQARINKF